MFLDPKFCMFFFFFLVCLVTFAEVGHAWREDSRFSGRLNVLNRVGCVIVTVSQQRQLYSVVRTNFSSGFILCDVFFRVGPSVF